MSRALTVIITLFLLVAVAQETETQATEAQETEIQETETQETGDQDLERRIITIEASGGTQSGNIRTGPLEYSHPDPEGVVATVSTLTIYAQRATLSAPEGVLLSQARGEREASFVEGVRVSRGRMSATGPELVYSEVTGRGSLAGPTRIVLVPEGEDEDEVEITADAADFDVDADTSTSRGGVTLISGRSSAEAEEIVFEEERELAVLRDESGQVTIVRRDDENGDLTITADEIRVLTGSDRLLARGNVTLTSGNTTSTGDTVYFDDESSRAEILGAPALSIEVEDGAEIARVSAPRLEQNIDTGAVRVLDASLPSEFVTDDFVMTSETQP